jgi:hypothetical protein
MVEKPTTLSGAASQIDLPPQRSRKSLGLAMVAAALLAGGSVAFVKLQRTKSVAAATSPAPASARQALPPPVGAEPIVETKPSETTLVETPEIKQETTLVETTLAKTEPTTPVLDVPVVVKSPPTQVGRRSIGKKSTPPAKATTIPTPIQIKQPPIDPKPADPKPSPLIERDID